VLVLEERCDEFGGGGWYPWEELGEVNSEVMELLFDVRELRGWGHGVGPSYTDSEHPCDQRDGVWSNNTRLLRGSHPPP
jgi:hypothetical protein